MNIKKEKMPESVKFIIGTLIFFYFMIFLSFLEFNMIIVGRIIGALLPCAIGLYMGIKFWKKRQK